MNILHAITLGIVEGITEFLPISSTGHLIITSKLLGLDGNFTATFQIAIQSGAILAVILLYGKTLLQNSDLLKKTITAFLPTLLIGTLLYKIVKTVFLDSSLITLLSLFIGGVFLILFELYYKKMSHEKSLNNLSYRQALIIGTVQSLAMIPGVSRSAATIIGGFALGLNRKTAVEFSFILAIPTLLAATTLDLLQNYEMITPYEYGLLLIGLLTSAIVAFIVIKWFLSFVKQYSFIPFGIYRIIAALVFYLLLL